MNDHNNPPSPLDDETEKAPPLTATGEELRSIIERVERLQEERAGLNEDIKDILAGAKSSGYDVKTIRYILKIRKMDASDRAEQEALVDTYLAALGML